MDPGAEDLTNMLPFIQVHMYFSFMVFKMQSGSMCHLTVAVCRVCYNSHNSEDGKLLREGEESG